MRALASLPAPYRVMETDSPPGVPIPEGSRQQVPVRIGEQTSQRPVITSKQTGASFVLLSVLVSDKNQTTILLGGPAYEEGRGLAVHPTARVIVKVSGLRGVRGVGGACTAASLPGKPACVWGVRGRCPGRPCVGSPPPRLWRVGA
jgi:hypothetical protein